MLYKTNIDCSLIKKLCKLPLLDWRPWAIFSETKSKIHMVCDLILSQELDILGITVSWLTGTCRDDPIIAGTLPNYDFHYVPRTGRKGGGVCICLRKSFKVRTTIIKSFESFQYIGLAITSCTQKPLCLIIIMPSKYKRKTKNCTYIFFASFHPFLRKSPVPDHLLITGTSIFIWTTFVIERLQNSLILYILLH